MPSLIAYVPPSTSSPDEGRLWSYGRQFRDSNSSGSGGNNETSNKTEKVKHLPIEEVFQKLQRLRNLLPRLLLKPGRDESGVMGMVKSWWNAQKPVDRCAVSTFSSIVLVVTVVVAVSCYVYFVNWPALPKWPFVELSL